MHERRHDEDAADVDAKQTGHERTAPVPHRIDVSSIR
jgi:hypothetical protein